MEDHETIFLESLQSGVSGRKLTNLMEEFDHPINKKFQSSQRTLLHHAVLNDNLDAVNTLINAVADVNVQDGNGNTPLMLAAERDNTPMFDLLRQNGGTLTERNDNGNSALHIAVQEGHTDMVQTLIDAFCSVTVTNKEGKTPIELTTDPKLLHILDPDNEYKTVEECSSESGNEEENDWEDVDDENSGEVKENTGSETKTPQCGNGWVEGGQSGAASSEESQNAVKKAAMAVGQDANLDNLVALRKLLSVETPPINDIIESNILPTIVELCDSDIDKDRIHECLWIICNIFSGDTTQCRTMVDLGGVSMFAKHLKNECEKIASICTWGLANVAGDCSAMRDVVVSTPGLIGNFVHHMKRSGPNSSKELIDNIAFLASNISRTKPAPDVPLAYHAALIKLYSRLPSNHSAYEDFVWAFAYASDRSTETMMKAGFPSVVPLIFDHVSAFKMCHIRLLGALSSESEEACALVLPYLNKILACLSTPKMVKEVFWMISNVIHDTQKAEDAVVKAGFFDVLEKIEIGDLSHSVKRELSWVVTNAIERKNLLSIIKKSRHFDEYKKMTSQYPHLQDNWDRFCVE